MAIVNGLNVPTEDFNQIHWLVLIGITVVATPVAYITEKRHDRELGVAEIFANAQAVVDDIEDEDEEEQYNYAVEQLANEIKAKKAELARLKNSVGEAPRGV